MTTHTNPTRARDRGSELPLVVITRAPPVRELFEPLQGGFAGQGEAAALAARAARVEAGLEREMERSAGNARVRLRIGRGSPAPRLSRAELLELVRGASAIVSMFDERVDDEYLEAAGPALRGVCNYAVGYDNIDLAACARREVVVAHTPDVVTEGTANIAWGLLLSVTRRIVNADAFCRSGAFEREGNGFPDGWCGLELTGRVLLIVGAGRIGLAVARRARAFGMRVAYVARGHHPEFEEPSIGATRVELDAGLAMADVVSLHTPLTSETRHLLDARRLALLKPEAVLINTARGAVIDEAALATVLERGAIWGAGLDVFEHEPRIDERLRRLTNVVMTPHIGSGERGWRIEMTRLALFNAALMATGQPAHNPVPGQPSVYRERDRGPAARRG